MKLFSTALSVCVAASALLAACATETSKSLATPQVISADSNYNGPRFALAIGKFENRSSFLRGLFSDGVDRLGNQSKTILISHLQQANRFSVMDRDNLGEAKFEKDLEGKTPNLKSADYLITGDITEFGRKEVGDQQLFGLLGRGKTQVAYAKVTLNVVNTANSEVVFSVQGAGEYALSNREVIGFGGTASYDATLTGKVLDLAIREGVNKLVIVVDQGKWKRGS
jgi:curli biogenesis system outer membrane secretion channel CsgG